MPDYPKYEKISDTQIRIIVEKQDIAEISKVIETKKLVEAKISELTKTLDNINAIIENAEQLGMNISPTIKK